MARRPTAKQLVKAHAAFREAVTQYLLSKGACQGDSYDYRIDTPAGRLDISVWDSAIMTRFDDVQLGKQFTASCGRACNPFTGKWNFHFADEPVSLNPENVLFEFGFFFEQLLEWEPRPAEAAGKTTREARYARPHRNYPSAAAG